MRVILILDQIQSGLGTKDDKDLPLGLETLYIGPAVMMRPYLDKLGIKVSHCIYCGTRFFFNNESKILEKLKVVLTKANPDVVICGPSYNYADFSKMSAHIAAYLKENTNIKVMCAMSKENEEVINEYKNLVPILKMPKKGEGGLSSSIEEMCNLTDSLIKDNNLDNYQLYR